MKKFFILVISASVLLTGCVFPNFSKTPVPHLDRVLPLESTVVDAVKGKVPVLKDAGTWRLHGTVDVSDGPVKIRVKDTHGTALRITIAEDFAQLDRSGTRYTEGGTLRR